LLELLDLFLDNDVEMDSLDECELQNQAHAIIYGSLFERFGTLSENKRRFKDESERLYIDELKKYSSA